MSTPSTVAPPQPLQPPRRNGRVPLVAARHPTYSSPHPGAADRYSRVLGLGTFRRGCGHSLRQHSALSPLPRGGDTARIGHCAAAEALDHCRKERKGERLSHRCVCGHGLKGSLRQRKRKRKRCRVLKGGRSKDECAAGWTSTLAGTAHELVRAAPGRFPECGTATIGCRAAHSSRRSKRRNQGGGAAYGATHRRQRMRMPSAE